jgi:hypothetical protein
MIARIWRGWTTPEMTDAYESLFKGEIIVAIQGRHIPAHFDARARHYDLCTEVSREG